MIPALSTTKPAMAIRSLCLLFCLLIISSNAWADADEVHIGVLAKRGFEISHQRWDATAAYLSEQLPEYKFTIIPMSFDDIPIIVKNRLVDFVIVNSGIYVDLSVRYGARRILTLVNELSSEYGSSKFGSVIFTLADNTEIKELSDLKNHRVAAVHPTSLGGWNMAQRELLSADLDRWDFASLMFLNTHDAVVNAIQQRKADAGIVRTDTLERMSNEELLKISNLRVLSPKKYKQFPHQVSTPLYPEWPLAMLSHTPLELARNVAITLLSMPTNHPAASDARIHGWTIPENYQPVDDLLRLLALPPYDMQIDEKFFASLSQHWHWYLLTLIVLLSIATLSFRIIRLNRSLSEHKTTLELSREAQLATFEKAAVGLAHVTTSGHFLQMNQKLCDIISLDRQLLQDINLKDILVSSDLPTCIKAIDQLCKNKLSSTSLQLRINCANGQKKWIQLSLSTKPDANNQVDYLVAVIDDIDKYKKLEAQSLLAQQQKELILNIAGDGIIGLDSKARYTFVNPAAAELLGYKVEEMIGEESRSLGNHSSDDNTDKTTDQSPILDVLKSGETRHGERNTIWSKEGNPLQIEFTSTPIMKGDEVDGAVIVLHALTSDQPPSESPQTAP
ncbi:MAG: PhnD/SsuA/transferrin family substrate-binding protein [Candidatus Thiodiazotropha lotti]|nr:PhnD/SsuA/transferrin family substrate-binding protein [Candidatus Thiodiazotropha lotti]MCG8002729.1 PhnD/SsuA/transferrin family substrate-binding protein [Candidatus Thiodiazotropha lotti]MCG8007074.1 PhnD/SsuA/transferrin family substrate-binding protein [Candidatus Thiodiazotropha lotti]MCW4186349.1 PhnD/SsuA/transferrin family substrate-binding protein [Candidatus Thiodiazotropha lotti]MCW4194655.1 PhnD/SsuA/transferrin family substrate-binding protein [Candidatus Thiodiazotropha lotti